MIPKLCIVSADEAGQIDGTIKRTLFDFLPTVTSESKADAVIVFISYLHVFKFSDQLLQIKKPIILCDFSEFGWNSGDAKNLWGTGITHQFGHFNTPEYARFDDWVRDHPPVLEFKRELKRWQKTATRLPIEFPCRLPAAPLQSKREFDARPLEVFSNWGLSNPARPRLHGAIFQNAHDCGINFVDSWEMDDHFEGRTWATIHTPHYNRRPIEEVMRWNQRAKISVSLMGAGIKGFRHGEAPVGSIMALPYDSLCWSFDWNNGENCIRLQSDRLFEDLEEATHSEELFSIYNECQRTVDKYRSERFVNEYVLPEIAKIL